jgi:hypothetical protein
LAKLKAVLVHDHHELRERFWEMVKTDPTFKQQFWITIEDEREYAFAKLKKTAREGFISGTFVFSLNKRGSCRSILG